MKTALVGATGYAGAELTRLLLRHPRVGAPLLLSREAEGATELASPLDGSMLPLLPFSWKLLQEREIELLFLATPHEVSREWVPEALRRGLRVVDLSGAWRLQNPEYRAVYQFKENGAEEDGITACAVYGIPELRRNELREAQLVANPGCYPTSVILALAPLLSRALVDLSQGIVCDCKSGVSGAGKKPTAQTHFVETAENFRAYAAFTHRHTGEILEQLELEPEQLTFSAHLLPIRRGILSSVYVRLNRSMTDNAVETCLREFYRGSRFVRVFRPPRLPEIQLVAHTNFCDLGWVLAPDGVRLMIVSCIDNLVKGAAGQAVQNMNLMCGWSECEGLLQ